VASNSEMLKTVANFTDPVEAHFAKTLLEAEGIPAAVCGDNLPSLGILPVSVMNKCVEVQVNGEDYDRAVEILSREIDSEPEQKSPEEPGDAIDDTSGMSCPKCGSKEVCKPRLTTFGYLLALFMLDFSTPAASNKWKCLDCGHEWDAPK